MTRRKVLPTHSTPTGPSPGPKTPSVVVREDGADPLGRDERHQQFGPLLEFSPDAIVIVDADGLVREWNPAAELMLLTTSPPAVQAPLREFLCAPHREAFDTAWLQLLAGHAVPRVKAPPGLDVGSEPPLDLTVAPIRVGEILVGAVVIFRDLTRQRSVERASIAQTESPPVANPLSAPMTAELDGPAGLPGAWWLLGRLSEPPAAGMERGVAVFDIDAFATLTASYGPDAGDAVLLAFGERLRSLDTPGTFAHWRAESFVWIVDSADPVADLNNCVAKLTEALEQPFQVGNDRGWLTLSIGLATTTLVGSGDLFAAAQDALQTAKAMGGSATVYYDQSMEASATSRSRLASDLHHAIDHEELRLHYQPILDFATNEVAGVEALVRWEHPGVGLLHPVAFIDTAERTGQIIPLGNWVVRTACSDAPRLGSHSGGPRTMSINVSANQLSDPGLITTLREAMLDGKCAPSTIVIEVTESVLLQDLTTVATSLKAIKALDVGLDLDDFGTGYSSLQYLRNLPIDRVKVDQSFVAGLGVNGADTAIVASTIALAHALGLRSVAEGVETAEQLALLREMGCDFAQGYLLSRPADIDTFTTWLDAYVPAEVLPTTGSPAAARSRRRNAAHARRDKKADARDTTADNRDANADERERIADLRDAAATEREHAQDDRELENEGSDSTRTGGSSSPARRTALQARTRATAERVAEASDRARAGQGRDDASAERDQS